MATIASRTAADRAAAIWRKHQDLVRRVAERHCPHDPDEIVGRTAALLLSHVDRLDPQCAAGWLAVVARHEAWRLARELNTQAPLDDVHEAPAHDPIDVLDARAALNQLRPDERLALVGRAAGYSYLELAARQGWTRTKVNRCTAEGRARARALVATGPVR